ncbi:MAG: maltose alpha-D-glucosyltransferase [Candidatus Caenarcaniphilales bacterium]|nr:maltose alpha-D-glucosyltransferase [Candidatus Caenarcaniphilales bacterium]
MVEKSKKSLSTEADENPLWYKDGIMYEAHIRAFYDSNADGIGDLQGIIKKLDYIKDLGVNILWLLPFYPSPLKDDGYDIADYYSIHENYGSIEDFKELLHEAHRRGIKVVTEIVLNHTSDQNQWFQLSRKSPPGSEWRNFYVWSDTPDKYTDARIIFKDFETSNWSWDPEAKAYFWHRFYSNQPDLNFDNPKVRKTLLKVIDYWLEMGVDGLRLDAIPYLYEREGTNCENLPETHEFIKSLRAHIDKKFQGKMLLAEANQWPEDAVHYFGDGDQCHMNFHFPLMPRMFMALQMEDSFPIIDILDQTPKINDSCQWALFLRNHDELTLEMVTDEERDYMYRVYAKNPKARINLGIRRRLAPLLDNNRRKIELLNILLFSLPGTPIVYYGDEIGMGDNYYLGDRNGVRTPMQWSPDRNAGFSKGNPQQLYLPTIIDPEYHYEAVNVENQEKNTSSLLWWMKRVIATRKRYKAFGRGSFTILKTDNPKVLAFIRQFETETLLVVVNLSRFSQAVSIDLSEYLGAVPTDLFSNNAFPIIKEGGYNITLGAYDYFWFSLDKTEAKTLSVEEKNIPSIRYEHSLKRFFTEKRLDKFELKILPAFFKSARWFTRKLKNIQKVKINNALQIIENGDDAFILMTEVFYVDGSSEFYILPVVLLDEAKAQEILLENPNSVIAWFEYPDSKRALIDAVHSSPAQNWFFKFIAQNRKLKINGTELSPSRSTKFKKLFASTQGAELPSNWLKTEQSNSSIVYSDKAILKLYRRIEEGINPDSEINSLLTESTDFKAVPAFLGSISYKADGLSPIVLGILQEYIPNQGNGWSFSIDALQSFYDKALANRAKLEEIVSLQKEDDTKLNADAKDFLKEHIGEFYLEMIAQLARRTAEFHIALSSVKGKSDFTPEPFSMLYQRSIYQSMRGSLKRAFYSLYQSLKKLSSDLQSEAKELIGREKEILNIYQKITEKKINTSIIRIHGDYHLGQVLFTGKDFVLIDFEGEPTKPLSERRLKRSSFRDVAGMMRSFSYAANSSVIQSCSIREEDCDFLKRCSNLWYEEVSSLFLKEYLSNINEHPFFPKNKNDISLLLQCFLLDKAVYELSYELNSRPDWVEIPLLGIKKLIDNPLI